MKYVRTVIPICFASMLMSCAEIDRGLKGVTDALAPRDIVTGKRTLNLEPEADEIQRATDQTTELLNGWRSQGVGVDTDRSSLSKLEAMTTRIASVSHRPHLSWEIHLIEKNEVNAFTIGGGKLFVYRALFGGLVDSRDENEVAAVLAHEIAHVSARHVGKREALQRLGVISQGGRGKLLQASFNTLQEDEADRIGLLYMALDGHDPRAAANVWQRAHLRYGSDPGNYTYDHSLNIQRFEKVRMLIPIAMKYFRGQGIRNENYDRLRVENDLLPRQGSSAGDSGFLALLEAGLGSYSDYLNARNEKLHREAMIQQERLLPYANIANVRIANTPEGYRGIFGQVQNIGNQVIKSAEVTVYYHNRNGQILYAERLQLPSLNLWPGASKPWGTYLKDVPGMSGVGAAVTRVER